MLGLGFGVGGLGVWGFGVWGLRVVSRLRSGRKHGIDLNF